MTNEIIVSHMPAVEILPVTGLEPQVWDWVFTCFEPLVEVTGGIGTYHRLLLEELSKTGRKVLVLTREMNCEARFLPGLTMFNVDDMTTSKPFNFVGLEHEFFSLRCHFALQALYQNGHRFRFVEFSDYGGDGFYPLRARAAGAYDLGTTAVRIHSPNVMLVEDNGNSHSHIEQFQRDQIDREMSVYEDADVILFGGDAIRSRVLELTERFGLQVADKMVKCPHPYPRHLFDKKLDPEGHQASRSAMLDLISSKNKFSIRSELETGRFVGIFGRIEDRKGQFQFFWRLLHDPDFVKYIQESNLHFLLAGHNVLSHLGHFDLNDLFTLIHSRKLASRFHFVGRVPQKELARLANAVSGFIFPSIFENYPNALLEVLPLCKPVALSIHGCMPEITNGFAEITHIDPRNPSTAEAIAFLDRLPAGGEPASETEFAHRVSTFEARQDKMLAFYNGSFPEADVTKNSGKLTVGFVVPAYQDHKFLETSLESIREALHEGDKIVVVDDASAPENASEIARIAQKMHATLIRLPENAGPAAARLAAVQELDVDLVQFCDSDDLLEASGLECARQAFLRDPELSMVTGVMSCFQDANHCWVPRNGHLWTAVEAHFAHSGSMFRRGPLLSALSHHERLPLNEDWLTSLLILGEGGKCRMIPVITYHYRRFDGTRSTRNQSELGWVNQKILDTCFSRLSFSSPEQNARIGQMMRSTAFHLSVSNRPAALPGSYPLRYQAMDALFFRIARNERLAHILLALKRKWQVRKMKNG
jgi:hypothetical protein